MARANLTRPIRIASCSGSVSDRRHAIHSLASNYHGDPIDVIVGDWMSEANMTARAWQKVNGDGAAFEPTFVEALEPALPFIGRHGIRVITNAGATDAEKLRNVVVDMVHKKGLKLSVAWISGDEVSHKLFSNVIDRSVTFENIYTGEVLREWKYKPLYAQAYLGGLGIAAALAHGADIVICGRVSDASPIIGAAAWWHSWQRSDLDYLANAFVTGHLIECSTYVCGGNFTGFKALERQGWEDIGFPIAEISSLGEVVITKQQNSGGLVSVDTCLSQLLYEIQGPWYFNSDVTAILDRLWFEQVGPNRVALHGVKGSLPPPTTKVGITADGGYQAEAHWFLVGLDIDEKARMMEAQLRKLLKPYSDRFSVLEFQKYGSASQDPSNQASATVDFRIFAQAPKAEDLAPHKFLRICLDTVMQAYPGATPHLDIRQGFPKQVFEYFVTLLPQSQIRHIVHLHSGEQLTIPPPPRTRNWPKSQPSQVQTAQPTNLNDFGPTKKAPLGRVAHARSGDKGSDANVGFWTQGKEEWEWLRSLLSVAKVKELLAEEYNDKAIVS
jgi:Acyclic terpene utilisation family protein AtuA